MLLLGRPSRCFYATDLRSVQAAQRKARRAITEQMMGCLLGAPSRATAVARACAVSLACIASQAQSVHADSGSWQSTSGSTEALVIGELRFERWIAEPLLRAAEQVGVDPAYLVALADKESSLRPLSRARSSSAEGLFQFIDETWLHVVRRHAHKHGLVGVVDAVKTVQGRSVPQEDRRTWLLNLRRDPYISTLMVAEMVKEHREVLAGLTERDPSHTELYAAHFLGLNGASRFVKLLHTKPQQSASRAFPAAAKANTSIFFEPTKRKRRKALSLRAVWTRFEQMMSRRVERYAILRAGLTAWQAAIAN